MQLLYSFARLTSPPSFINLWWSSRIVSREREEHGPFHVEGFRSSSRVIWHNKHGYLPAFMKCQTGYEWLRTGFIPDAPDSS